MTFFVPQPVTASASQGYDFAAQIRLADPFTASNLTFTEVVASTTNDWGGFRINNIAEAWQRGMFIVATGAVSSETIIAVIPLTGSRSFCPSVDVPIAIPAGTRVCVAASSATTSTIKGQIIGFEASGFSRVPTYTRLDCGPFDLDGGSISYGNGVVVDPGATINTKGSYTELSIAGTNSVANNLIQGDSLPNDYDWLGVAVNDGGNNAQSFQHRLWDFATGAVSSETIFLGDVADVFKSLEYGMWNYPLWTPEGAAAGTRFSARMQCDITDASDRLGQVYLYGLR